MKATFPSDAYNRVGREKGKSGRATRANNPLRKGTPKANRRSSQREATREMRGRISLTSGGPSGRRGVPSTANPARRALTLVELLVVIVIISALVTTVLPVLSPGGDERKIREASRQVNAFLSGAQTRAIQTGRPYGVALKRLSADTDSPEDNGVAVELQYVEVPPPFTGFDDKSLARVCWNPGLRTLQLQLVRYGTNNVPTQDGLPSAYDADPIPPQFLRPLDRIEVAGHAFYLLPYVNRRESGNGVVTVGAIEDDEKEYFVSEYESNTNDYFPITFAIAPTSTFPRLGEYRQYLYTTRRLRSPVNPITYHASHDNLGGDAPTQVDRSANAELFSTGPFWSAPLPYKILRQAVPSAAPPLQLPAGAAIDLQASGFAKGDVLYKPDWFVNKTFSDPVRIMFTPEGTIGSMLLPLESSNQNEEPQNAETFITSSLALCVGRRELIPAEVLPGRDANEPIDLAQDLDGLNDEERQARRNKYNWLNLESRWVVVGAQSGSISTVPNAFVNPAADGVDGDGDGVVNLHEQLLAARENAPRRAIQGGR